MRSRKAFSAPLGGLILAAALAGCGRSDRADQAGVGGGSATHVHLAVEASSRTRYEMLCQVRTYQWAPERYANRYGLDRAGRFSDDIPSPHAHCTARIVSGPPPLRITLSKPGSTGSMTIGVVGDAGKRTLHIW